MEAAKKEIAGYKFIKFVGKENFKLFFCNDCITSREKKFAKPKNIIPKKYKTGKSFLICDRCGKII